MPRFDYVALTSQGKEMSGTVEAADLGAAREDLRRRALMPLKLELERGGSGGLGLALFNPGRYMPVNSKDKQFLFRQLALMVKSGHRLRASLEMLESFASKIALQKSLRRMINRIDEGGTFADAIRGEGRIFPRFIPALIAAGERSGTLDKILEEVASSMERARMLRNTLLRALVMPSITLFVAFGVLAFVVLWLVPKLTDFLVRGGGTIHWTMQILVDVNDFLYYNGKFIAVLLGVLMLILIGVATTRKGKLALDRAWFALPLFGRTSVMYEMAQFGGIGHLLIRSGLRQVETLRVLGEVSQNTAMRDHYERSADHLLEGQRMSDALKSPIFDDMARHMVGIGENSGSLDEVLDHMGTYFSNEVETRIQVIFSTLVPALTILVGMVVAVIYISVLLTILGAVNSIR